MNESARIAGKQGGTPFWHGSGLQIRSFCGFCIKILVHSEVAFF